MPEGNPENHISVNQFSEEKYVYYFNYGVIVFSGHSEDEIKFSIKAIQPYERNPYGQWLRDDHEIQVAPGNDLEIEFEHVGGDHLNARIVRITMLTLAQSVALDYYHEVSENLLTEIKGFTKDLERTGKLSMGRRNMLKFIGKALNTQNDIADNIYIFDAPEQVWDDEYLDKLHKGLIRHFDLRVSYSEIDYTLRRSEDNLSFLCGN